MDDRSIIRLYWERNPEAITAAAEKYTAYCTAIARSILSSREDAEECVNDTWLGAWNAIPPHRPKILASFLGRITRNLSLNRLKRSLAEKRCPGETVLILDELSECVSGREDPAGECAARELAEEIDRFLSALPKDKRGLFVRRYWYMDPIPSLAKRFGIPLRTVQAWHIGERVPPDYVVSMMVELLEHDKAK